MCPQQKVKTLFCLVSWLELNQKEKKKHPFEKVEADAKRVSTAGSARPHPTHLPLPLPPFYYSTNLQLSA